MDTHNNESILKEFDWKVSVKDKEAKLLKLLEIEKEKIENDAKANLFAGTLAV